MSAVSCDTCGYLKSTQRPLTRQKSPFSVLSALHQISQSPLIGASSAFWSLWLFCGPGGPPQGFSSASLSRYESKEPESIHPPWLISPSRALVSVPFWASSHHSAPGRLWALLSGVTRCVQPGGGDAPLRSPSPACAMAVRFPSACLTFFPSQGGKGFHVSRPIVTQSAWKHL